MSVIALHQGVLHADSLAMVDCYPHQIQKLYQTKHAALAHVGELLTKAEVDKILALFTDQIRCTGTIDARALMGTLNRNHYLHTDFILVTRDKAFRVNLHHPGPQPSAYNVEGVPTSVATSVLDVHCIELSPTSTYIAGSCVSYLKVALELGYPVVEAVAKMKPFTSLNGPITHSVKLSELEAIA